MLYKKKTERKTMMADFQVNNYRSLIRTTFLSILKMRIHAVFNKLRHAMCLLSGFKGLKSKEIGGTENWRSKLCIRNENLVFDRETDFI